MNKKCVGNVISKSHPKSHITILPIGSPAFEKIFNCKSPSITYPAEIGNDVTDNIVILQATVCDNYAVIEYMTEINYYFHLAKEAK